MMAAQIVTVLLFHLLPAWSLIRYLPVRDSAGQAAVIGFFLLLGGLLLFGRDVAFLRDRPSARTVYRLSMLSFVLVLNLFMASLLNLAARLVLTVGRWPLTGRVTLLPAWGLAVLLVVFGLVNARSLRVRRILFESEAIPPSWDNRSVVFFSDTHYGPLNGPEMAEVLVKRISGLEPDLVIFGGDLFDGPGGRVADTLKVLDGLTAPLGVIAVLGNHDYYYLTRTGSSRELLERQRRRDEMPAGSDTALSRMKSALPWTFLENSTVEIEGLKFAGLRPFSLPDEAAAGEFLRRLDREVPTVLLNHKPTHIGEAAAAGVILQLSGHTHGGPVFPVNLVMRKVFRGRHFGTTRHGSMVLDTSSGSGISLWYPRTAGRHEVVRIRFVRTAVRA